MQPRVVENPVADCATGTIGIRLAHGGSSNGSVARTRGITIPVVPAVNGTEGYGVRGVDIDGITITTSGVPDVVILDIVAITACRIPFYTNSMGIRVDGGSVGYGVVLYVDPIVSAAGNLNGIGIAAADGVAGYAAR